MTHTYHSQCFDNYKNRALQSSKSQMKYVRARACVYLNVKVFSSTIEQKVAQCLLLGYWDGEVATLETTDILYGIARLCQGRCSGQMTPRVNNNKARQQHNISSSYRDCKSYQLVQDFSFFFRNNYCLRLIGETNLKFIFAKLLNDWCQILLSVQPFRLF